MPTPILLIFPIVMEQESIRMVYCTQKTGKAIASAGYSIHFWISEGKHTFKEAFYLIPHPLEHLVNLFKFSVNTASRGH